jgi:hypothetical protein
VNAQEILCMRRTSHVDGAKSQNISTFTSPWDVCSVTDIPAASFPAAQPIVVLSKALLWTDPKG